MKEDSTAKKLPVNAALPRLAAVAGGPPSQKERLLLVDDEPHVLEGLALHLRRNYAIVARRTAADALRALATEGPFVAVISDLRMPGMDGVQFLVEVKKRAPHTCRLLLTGHGDMNTAVAAVNEAGVHHLLTKPCPPAILAAALDKAIAGARETRHAASNDILDLGALSMGDTEIPRAPEATDDIGLLDFVEQRLGGTSEIRSPSVRVPRVENVEIGGLLCAARDSLYHHAGGNGVAQVRVVLPTAPLYVRGDAAVLEAMILNLLKNGADAIEANAQDRAAIESLLVGSGADPAICVKASVYGGTALIEVIDNGRSIADTDLDRLFDAYVASKPAETEAGMGLAIIRETVSRHQGKLWAEIVPTGGTRFVVELPIADTSLRPSADIGQSDFRSLKPSA